MSAEHMFQNNCVSAQIMHHLVKYIILIVTMKAHVLVNQFNLVAHIFCLFVPSVFRSIGTLNVSFIFLFSKYVAVSTYL